MLGTDVFPPEHKFSLCLTSRLTTRETIAFGRMSCLPKSAFVVLGPCYQVAASGMDIFMWPRPVVPVHPDILLLLSSA